MLKCTDCYLAQPLCYGSLSSPRPQVATQNLCRFGRPAARCKSAAKRARQRPPAPRLFAHGHAGRGQNHHRPHPGQKPELRKRATRRTVRPMPILPRHRRRAVCGFAGNRRRIQHRYRQHPRSAGKRPIRAHRRQIQSLYHRRSAHALQIRVQRHAQNAGRAARTRQIHPGHHRPAQSPHHRVEPLPAIRIAQPHAATSGRPLNPRFENRKNRVRTLRARPFGTRRPRFHARCLEPARPSHRHGFGQREGNRRTRHDWRGGQTLPI